MPIGTMYSFVIKYLQSEIAEDYKVLETGCGAALYREVVVAQKADYIGTDIPNQHYGNLASVDSFCSSEQLPFKDEVFDLLYNQGAIDYMPNLLTTLKEAYRVLAPGGRMIIFTYRKDVLEMIHNNVSVSNNDWETNHHVFSPEELLHFLSQAGFSANDISFEVNSWEPLGIFKKIFEISRLYPFFNRKRSIWRVFTADKSN